MSIDDEDWLYRRGRYADGAREDAPRSRPPEPPADARRPADPPPSRYSEPSTQYGAPTPVGHYGSTQGSAGGPPPQRPPQQAPRQQPPRQTAPPPRSVPPRGAPTRRRRRGRPLVWILVLVLAYFLGVPMLTWPFMPRVEATPAGERPANTPGQVFVLAGSDSREGLSKEEQDRLGTGDDAGRRTDTIMMLYVPPTGRAALVSIPRDSYVEIPGHGKNKINAAYSLGGPELLVRTVEQSTGVRVDGYAEIGFGGFSNVVDAVGGIEMCPERAIKDPPSNLDIPAGCQEMDGPTALGYVRMRKVDPEGDLGRAKRQREMISALAKKTLSPGTLFLPWRWWGVNRSLSQGITIGQDDGPLELFGLGNAAIRIATGQGDTLMVPVGNADAHTPAGSTVLWHEQKAPALFAAMQRGEGDLKPYA